MALQLVILLSFISVNAWGSETWKDELRTKYSKGHRISFGESSINYNEAEAIQRARQNALSELAKSFFVTVSSSSQSISNYQQSSNTESFREEMLFSQVNEESRSVELTGVDVSQFKIDREHNVVSSAAIIEMSKFENYLQNKIRASLEDIETKDCSNIQVLNQYRKKMNALEKARELEEVLSSFSSHSSKAPSLLKTFLPKVKKCREKFTIVMKKSEILPVSEVKKIFVGQGFNFKGSSSGKASILLTILSKVHPPEIKFERTNMLGNVEILAEYGGEEFRWQSPTIRQIDSTVESARMKLDVRLRDSAENGLLILIEDNF